MKALFSSLKEVGLSDEQALLSISLIIDQMEKVHPFYGRVAGRWFEVRKEEVALNNPRALQSVPR